MDARSIRGFIPDVLTHLGRLPILRRLFRRESGPILSVSLCSCGVVVALDERAAPAPVLISVRDRTGVLLDPTLVEPVSCGASGRFAPCPLPPEIFTVARRCRVQVDCGGASLVRHVEVGPGRVAVRFDGVADHHLRGWASSLSPDLDLAVALMVDGREVGTAPLDRFRPELMTISAAGGWNGFALPLPPTVFDRKPHELAVRIGGTTIPFGRWASRPASHVDHVGPERLTGWYFDAEERDEPILVRLEEEGETIASCPTGFRPDLKEMFGRDHGAFAFVGTAVTDGMKVMAGPSDTAHCLGTVRVEDAASRVARLRDEARTLLRQGNPAATLSARDALRSRIEAARLDPSTEYHLDPAPDGTLPSATPELRIAASYEENTRPACVIVPVYKGLGDTRACLESLLPQLGAGVRAIVVDDASPEPELGAYLRALSGENRPCLTILRNAANLGFIGTVNRALDLLRPGEDAVIVNADTILPPDAIARLCARCHAESGIASVTPMSNNATILSFPDPTAPNPLLLGLPTDAIDAAFRAIDAAPDEIPTGIGFCMILNGDALPEIGHLSPEWGRGYCEEVDWSLRARDLGWRHLAAADIFVTHEGSVSFGIAERSAILDTNHARLEAKYPEYLGEVHAVVAADPWSRLRAKAAARLLATRFRRLTLFITHGLGGGTKRYLDDLCSLERAPDHAVAVVHAAKSGIGGKGGLRLRFAFDAGFSLESDPAEFEEILADLEEAGLTVDLHVNSRLVFPASFLNAIRTADRPYTVTLHDFQWYCPKVHLVDERSFYCGEPPPDVCQLCVRHGLEHDFGDQTDLIGHEIEAWLAFNESFLRGAARLIAPSADTARRYADRLGLADIDVVPHPEPALVSARPAGERSGAVRIALVGALGFHKGFDLVVRMAEHAERRRLPVFFRVIGYVPDLDRVRRLSNMDVTGAYEADELPTLLGRFDPDVVFLSSVWPETYSYVLSEVWRAGYPVAAFDFGAPAERIRERGGGILLEPSRDAGAVLAKLMGARAARPPVVPGQHPALPTLDAYLRPLTAPPRFAPESAAAFAP